jgi:superfamily II DNA helicase RecQ
VPLTTSIIHCVITLVLVLVPLHGLGSDQVDKATVVDHGVKAYYIDEHKAENARVLEQRLHSYSEDKKGCSSIIIFASPNALRTGSRWLQLLSSMAAKDMISMLAIDESHEVHQSGRSFRPEFLEAVDNLKIIFHAVTSSKAYDVSDYDSRRHQFGL